MTGGGLVSVLAALTALFTLVLPQAASADEPDISASVDTKRVGVGDLLTLSLHAASSQYTPGRAEPGATPGFHLVGTASSPSQQVTITNGRMTAERGLDVNWSLRADKTGTWSIGPVSVQIGSATYRAGPIRIVVVPTGQGPQRATPDPTDPFGNGAFDPFRSLLDSINGGPQARPQDAYNADPKLALDAPLGTVAFLHATADTTDVVVGQQVTVSMYIYVDANVRDPGMIDVHEATAADFLKKPLFEDDNSDKNLARANVGGRLFGVRLLRKWALFPLKAGDLVVTPMELTLQRSRSTGDPSRKSEVLTIHVTEPPTLHRPPGYLLGDVGKFTLSSDVNPREVDQDGALGVTLTLEGTGNLPAMITPPAQAGVEWLAPEVHEKVGVKAGDHFGGSRTFSFVVRLHNAGEANLGSVRIPFWDPTARRYDVARTDLGPVTVRPSDTPRAAKDLPPDPFATVPDVRTEMGGTKPPAGRLAELHPVLFGLALVAAPLFFLVFTAATAVTTTVRDRRARTRTSPETDLRTKVAAAERASRLDDARAILAGAARALESATVVYAEVNVRDARGDEARQRLADAGVKDEVARRVAEALAEGEAARFSPEDPPLAEARARWEATKETIAALRRGA